MPEWRYLEKKSIADIAIEIKGKSFSDLLEGILYAFFEISTSKNPLKAKKYITKEVVFSGKNEFELIIAFVEELIFQKDVEGLVFFRGRFIKIGEKYKAFLEGGPVEKYGEGVDIKALSYHHLEVKKTKGEWRAILVFDV